MSAHCQTRQRTKPSFKNKQLLLQKIDDLPRGPTWECELWEVEGDEYDEDGNLRTETLELWRRNPVDCIKELIGNPLFSDCIRYAPERHYLDAAGTDPIWDEMWTGEWWWDLQVRPSRLVRTGF